MLATCDAVFHRRPVSIWAKRFVTDSRSSSGPYEESWPPTFIKSGETAGESVWPVGDLEAPMAARADPEHPVIAA